ncbi:solute carrier family 51 subunit beta [Syngnathus acus]|uniref:solute carrier family 51 subunit beta n=1 Tax=Syngnathus acus TaxID=161584 RepID=UPI001885EDAF|nr:solute carrier family 51 subunit beta [Syngnathus acus]
MLGGCLLLFVIVSGLRRASANDGGQALTEAAENKATVTDEQKEYLRWFYRTEDPTVWKFVLLGLAFVCLLVGFLLLGMGAMASRNRRKIAKYKAAAAALAHRGEDQTWPGDHDEGPLACGGTPSSQRTTQSPARAPPCNGDTGDMKAGSIVLTWKDGNTSCLYPDTQARVGVKPDDEGEARIQRDDEDEMKDGGDR